MADRPRVTAGVLLSRTTAGGTELAVVHRPRYDDWTWPKGGVEAGEHLVLTAAREAAEETGQAVVLGHRLGRTSYVRAGGSTEVHWWAATLADPTAAAGLPDPHEVDEVRWVSAAEAGELLTYPADRKPLSALTKQGPVTTTVLLVRHADAGDRKLWSGADAKRPLDKRGQARAARLARILPAYAPTRVVAGTPLRCRETVEPLADALGARLGTDRRWDDRSWERSSRLALSALAELTERPGVTAVCSQGETIPGLLADLAQRAGKPVRAAIRRASQGSGSSRTPRSKKGSYWVLSFAADDLVAADYVAD